jgi:menaquinone-dependent protoporphyrinogen IX oxidase
VIVHGGVFGNTEKVARALAKGHKDAGVRADCAHVGPVEVGDLASYDPIAVGAPTHAFSVTKAAKDLLSKMKEGGLAGTLSFAFDTKLDSRLTGSAAGYIESRLGKMKMEAMEPHSAILRTVNGSAGGRAELTEGARMLSARLEGGSVPHDSA